MLKCSPGARGWAGHRTCQRGGPLLVTLQGHRPGSGRPDAEEEAWATGGSSGAQKWGGGWRQGVGGKPSPICSQQGAQMPDAQGQEGMPATVVCIRWQLGWAPVEIPFWGLPFSP